MGISLETTFNRHKRILGYILGFLLFFGPLALFQRLVSFLLGKDYLPTIHTVCFRIPIEHILNGRFFEMGAVATLSTILLLVAAIFWGPIFCGKLCPAGAVPEYCSKMVPDRYKIQWSEFLPITSLRYGFLAGFLISPLVGSYLACSYCNYFIFDLFINYIFWGYAVAFSSSLLITLLLWFFVFGCFTKGGRGFCNFFCPVGALQNLVHSLGNKLGVACKLHIDREKCVGCGKCAKVCPMEAIYMENTKAATSIHHCIICSECVDNCPVQAISYGKKVGGANEQ